MSTSLGSAVYELTTDQTKFEHGLKGAEDSARGSTSRIGGVFDGLSKLGLGVIGIKGLADGVMGLAGSLVSGNAEFERYETQFGVLLGSADAAKQRLAELAEFGASTPFELPELVRADKILTAFGLDSATTADRFGVSAEQIRTTIGDVAAGTGAGFEALALTFGKFASGATGDAIARFQELGIATKEEMASWGLEFSKSGELLTPAREAFTILEEHVRGKFGGMMKAQAATFEGMMSNLSDWMGAAKRKLLAPVFEVLKERLQGVLDFLGSADFQRAFDGFANMLARAIGGAVDMIGQLWTLAQPAVGFLTTAFTTITTLIGQFVAYLSPGNDYDLMRALFGPDIGPRIDQVVRAVTTLWQQVGGFLDLLGAALSGSGADLGAWLNDLLVETGIVYGDYLAALGDLLGTIVTLVVENVGQWAQAFVAWVGPMIPPFLVELRRMGGALLAWIGEQVGPVLRQLGAWAGAFMDWVGPAISPVLTEAGRLLSRLLSWIAQQVGPVLRQLGDWGNAFVAWIQPTTTRFLAEWPGMLSRWLDWVAGAVGPLAAQLGQWASAFVAWVVPTITKFLAEWPGMLNSFLDWIGNAVPPIVAKLLQWAAAFVGWVAPQIPGILLAVGGIAAAILVFIAETVAVLALKLAQWGLAFIGWVAPQIPGMLAELAKLAWAMVVWITTDVAPNLIRQLATWGQTFVGWVVPALASLMAELGKLALRVGTWIVFDSTPYLVGQLIYWGDAFVGWVVPALASLMLELAKLHVKTALWITTDAAPNLVGLLVQWGAAFVGWVAKDALPALPGALANIFNAIVLWVTSTTSGLVVQGAIIAAKLIEGLTIKVDVPLDLGAILTRIASWVGGAMESVIAKGGDVASGMISGLTGGVNVALALGAILTRLGEWVGNSMVGIIGKGADVASGMRAGIEEGVKVALSLGGILSGIASWIAGAMESLVAKGKDMASYVLSGLTSALGDWGTEEGRARQATSMARNVKNALGDMSIPWPWVGFGTYAPYPDWLPDFKIPYINIGSNWTALKDLLPDAFKAAMGTNWFPGGLAVVGELGPELVALPRGSQVTPADRTRDLLQGGNTYHISVQARQVRLDEAELLRVLRRVELVYGG